MIKLFLDQQRFHGGIEEACEDMSVLDRKPSCVSGVGYESEKERSCKTFLKNCEASQSRQFKELEDPRLKQIQS